MDPFFFFFAYARSQLKHTPTDYRSFPLSVNLMTKLPKSTGQV